MQLLDGIKLTYAEYGAPGGAPVIYCHGLSGSRLEAKLLDLDAFARAGLRLIAPDRPGMGRSDFQPERGFSHWAADLDALAAHLQLEQFGVIGVSGGAGYALACACLMPERTTSVVILSGAGEMGSPEVRRHLPFISRVLYGLAARSPRRVETLLRLTQPRDLGDPQAIRQRMSRSLPPSDVAVFDQPGRLEDFIASGNEAMRQGVSGLAWDTHVCARPWGLRLEEIDLPVRLLHGEADRNVPVAVARRLAAEIPGCQATIYPGEGHFSTVVNHVDEVIAALDKLPVGG
jgi:pimeloyl-ACP methyl ester carboxylesterase